MLKKKLERQSASSNRKDKQNPASSREFNNRVLPLPSTAGEGEHLTSMHFITPFWKRFYDLECDLNTALGTLHVPANITHLYNPLVYAAEVHCDYLRKFLNGRKRLLLIGMNPGPNGMGQNGVPFGNTRTVRDLMHLSGSVSKPIQVHPKRPVTGLECAVEEPSGVRIWSLLQNLAGSLETFSQQCFVHNFCPLAFFDAAGKNITPSELKGDFKNSIRDICIDTLDKQIAIVQPEVIVAVGCYVFDCLKKKSTYWNSPTIRFLQLSHPSPRSVNNTDWPRKAEEFLQHNDLVKFLRNEV